LHMAQAADAMISEGTKPMDHPAATLTLHVRGCMEESTITTAALRAGPAH
jgi:hypothetical protein